MSVLPLLLAVACAHRDVAVEDLARMPDDSAVVARWDGGSLAWSDLGEDLEELDRMRGEYLAGVQGVLAVAVRSRVRAALLDAEARRRGLPDSEALRADLAGGIRVTDADLERWKAENDWAGEFEGIVLEDRVETAFAREAAVDPEEIRARVDAGTDPWTALVDILAERFAIAPDAVAALLAAEPDLDETAARLRLVQEEAGRRAASTGDAPVTEGEVAAFLAAHPEFGDEALRLRIRDERTESLLADLADRLWAETHARLALRLPEPVRVEVPEDGDPAWGPTGAAVTIVVFSDFQCPFCARLHRTLRDLRGRYGTRIRFVFRDAPLEMHPRARPAAAAAGCAVAQGRHEAMQDLLFEHQDALEDDDLERYAGQAGLDVAAWRACLADPATEAEIDRDVEDGARAGVEGVPTAFVNGIPVVGARPLEDFAEIVDRELAR